MTSPMSPDEVDRILRTALAGQPDEARLYEIMTSQEVANDLTAAIDANPAGGVLRTLIVNYATTHGGLVGDFLRLYHAPFWGDALILSVAQCTRVLNQPESVLRDLYESVMRDIRPELEASSEYRSWRSSR